jgi:hypothetical protein
MGPVIRSLRILSWVVTLSLGVCAHGETINFEGLASGTAVGSTYAGVTFTNAMVLTAGITLNDADFPPHSGSNVALDAGGPMQITFDTAISDFSAYFTYGVPLVITGFDSLGNPVATANSMFSGNFTSSGNPPNELLSLTYAQGIASLLLTGDPGGNSFVVDDISYTAAGSIPPPPTVPEPPGMLLMGSAMLAFLLLRASGRLQVNRVDAVSRS